MSVESRKIQESVVVGGDSGCERLLNDKVHEISGDRVRLGVEVEPGISVHRQEVWDGIRAAAGETC